MQREVLAFIEKHQLLKNGVTIVVGVSGGPDSMALLHFLQTLQPRLQLTLVVAHVDHQFRGETSYGDYQFVEQYTKEQQLIFEGTRIDVTSYAKVMKKTSQVAARECRYQFFQDVMEKYDADYLALAHHGDDQMETMLMRQTLAGFGESLCGIPVRRPFGTGEIIRPFLCVSKAAIEQYCTMQHLHVRRDESNEKDDYVRNRFRHTVLPFLHNENPAVHERYQLLSEACFDDEQYVKEQAKKALETIVHTKTEHTIIFNIAPFLTLPKSLQRRVIHLILNYLYRESQFISFVHIEQALQLVQKEGPAKEIHLPMGLHIQTSYGRCICSFQSTKEASSYRYELKETEELSLEVGTIVAQYKETIEEDKDTSICYVPRSFDSFPLYIRSRKQGDRIALPNGGTKKIKDLFIDAKMTRYERDRWPLVTDSKDRIIWVPNVKHSSLLHVKEEETGFIMLKFKEAQV